MHQDFALRCIRETTAKCVATHMTQEDDLRHDTRRRGAGHNFVRAHIMTSNLSRILLKYELFSNILIAHNKIPFRDLFNY